ncbi:hypothetical protein [Taibaiella chishuiensis]|uniref:Uncharacterized protein n=1 Tax=Taibaiella chishuiensis TaxID=1434707 RepID=A0A2P8D656_9BACT|nr:hypothetical protein [Taibaiella chishuiensis]PSK92671.1 hypothetical protein B0I18_103248 [Taibaiella chishuiensis]
MMTLEQIQKIKDPTERAIFEAAYWEVQKPPSGIADYAFLLGMAGVLLIFVLAIYLAVREYKRNNPRFRKVIA